MQEDFDTFNHIENNNLKAFNRAVMLYNILEDFGEVGAREYIANFSQEDKTKIYLILMAVKKFGVDTVRKLVLSKVETPEYV